jgi:hypothetical protein
MSVKAATCSAIAFSFVTLLACLYAISGIYSDVQNIWQELDNEISSIRVSEKKSTLMAGFFTQVLREQHLCLKNFDFD